MADEASSPVGTAQRGNLLPAFGSKQGRFSENETDGDYLAGDF